MSSKSDHQDFNSQNHGISIPHGQGQENFRRDPEMQLKDPCRSRLETSPHFNLMLVRDWLVLRVVAGNMSISDGGAESDGI